MLKKGADMDNDPYKGYINACFVNSPFDKVGSGAANIKGDAKIIAT